MMNPDVFQKQLEIYGYKVTKDFIRKLFQRGFIDKPVYKALGRGKGSASEYNAEMLAQAFANFGVKEKFGLQWDEIKIIKNVAVEAIKKSAGFGLLESIGEEQRRINDMALKWIFLYRVALANFEPVSDDLRPVDEAELKFVLKYEPKTDKKGQYLRYDNGAIKIKNCFLKQRSEAEIEEIQQKEAELVRMKNAVDF